MTSPQITVALPVFNGQSYISSAIESVLNQTHQNFELIVVDNFSSDETVKIVKKFADPRIKLVINQHNLGMIGNWNKAVSLASGEFIKILSHDDTLSKNCLEEQLKGFTENNDKNIGIVTSKKFVINESGQKIMPGLGLRGQTRVIDGRVAIRKAIRAGRNVIGEPSVVLVRTNLLREAGEFELPQYTPDIKMWFKILDSSNLFFLNRTLASYRLSASSTSMSLAPTQSADFIRLINDYCKYHPGEIPASISKYGAFRSSLNAKLRRKIQQLGNYSLFK